MLSKMQTPRAQFSPLLVVMAGVFVCLLASGAQGRVQQKEATTAAAQSFVKVNNGAFTDLLHKALIKVQGQLDPNGNLDVKLSNLSFEVLTRVGAPRYAKDGSAFFHGPDIAGGSSREETIHRNLKASPSDNRINISFYMPREISSALLSRYLSAY